MSIIEVKQSNNLSGEIQPQGAKNEALQILCAVILTDEEILIENIPSIIDVDNLIKILDGLGVKVIFKGNGSYSFKADKINLNYLQSEQFKIDGSGIRGSVMLMGPLLAKYGKAYIPKPGGDKIGKRPLDTHFKGFVNLGANFVYNKNDAFYGVEASQLKGASMILEEASVTGTANILMAAVLAEGITTIYNAACEPYLQQLCKMLNRMGAKITGIGSNLLSIEGVESLKGTKHKILPDMIEIGSWISLAAITQSQILIKNVSWENLGVMPNAFRKLGIVIEKKGDDIYIPSHKNGYEIESYIDGSIITLSDAPWPGLSPDLLSVLLVAATQAKGELIIHQKMFESRLFFVDKLIQMGANIILCDPHRAVVLGNNFKSSLNGIIMSSPDIRAGMALLIASLSAKGDSVIKNANQIHRGYENIINKLKKIGAKIDEKNN